MLFALPVVLSVWLRARNSPLVVAAVATLLIGLGYLLSTTPANADILRIAVANRALAVFAVWTTAAACCRWLRYAARLEQERMRLRTVVDTSADAVVTIDERGIVRSFSRGGERLFGYAEEEVVGRNVSLLMPSPYRDGHDGYIARYRETGEKRIIGTGRQVEALRKNGAVFPVHLMVGEVWTGADRLFTGFLHDMTDRVEAERALAEERDFLSTILDTTDALLIVTEPDGRIVRFNRACRDLTGLSSGKAIGALRSVLLPNEMDGQWLSIVERLKAGARQVRYESTWKTQAGERRDIAWSSTAILDEQGEVRYYVGAGIDITEARAAQTRADQLQHDLYRIGRLSELGEMASAIAHELNQPLTAIANYVGACRRMLAGLEGDRVRQIGGLMDKAVEQTDRAGQIIRRLRQLIGRGQSELEVTDINAVVRDAAALALIAAQEKGVTTRLDLADALPPVLADATQIQQVVFNLLRNSIDAMADCPRRQIVVRSLLSDDREVQVTVSDSGPGLAPEVAEQLFMPFVSTKPNGMGIGLSICRSIIDAHDGRIWATPESEGVTFAFALPAEPSSSEEEHE